MRPKSSLEDDRDMVLRTRRSFIRHLACAGVGMAAVSNSLRDFRLINAALAQGSNLTDYKALVCIFLSGGNDSNNLIIPRGTEYGNYAAVRQNLAIPESALNPISPINNDGHSYGFHPSCSKLATLFGEGKLATLFNVGPLLFPLTSAQYKSKSVATPPQLFSHSDQVTHWETSLPDRPPQSGWGGRVADMLYSQQPSAQIALCTSVAGANTFEVGNVVQKYDVSTSGAVTMSGVTGTRLQAVKDILNLQATPGQNTANLQEQAYGGVLGRAIDTGVLLNAAIAPTAATNYFTIPFSTGSLGSQLKMVARLIAAREALGMKRQIFFVNVGGYDTHTSQVGDTTHPGDTLYGAHANLMNELSEGIFAFQRALEQLAALPGSATLPASVTSFTASDFGRTFPTNGEGSDHGWGSHHVIVGGAVKGQRTYGTFPALTVGGPDDTSTGRWIPTVSVDEYSATLAKWFGVSNTNMNYVFPNLGRFQRPDLGFMP